MTTLTKAVWDMSVLTPEFNQIVTDQFNRFYLDGKTDGDGTFSDDTPVTGQRTVIRPWKTVEVATEWIAFLGGLTTAPISAEIIQ